MIIIDAGHGGFDPGGGSNVYFKEKDLTKKISLYQKQRFDELNIPSVLVRNTDETLDPYDRVERIKSLGSKQSDILISNHINNGGSKGGEVIYSVRTNKELPTMIGKELGKNGLAIRNIYQRLNRLGKDYYYILRDTNPNTAMIIEYGFADNNDDTSKLIYEWPILAEAVVKAITEYYQLPYSKPSIKTHIVKPNETLYSISMKYNTTVKRIKELNNLSGNTIYPGATLLIS